MSAYFERSLLEEEFKKRSARLIREETYYNRGVNPSYFTSNKKGTEAVMKLIHHRGNVRDLVKYVADDKKTGDGNHIYDKHGFVLSQEKLEEKRAFWHKRNSEDRRQDAIFSTHIVFSTKESSYDKRNIEILRSSVAEVIDKHFTKDGYDSFFTIHTDKPHLHAHVVIHNKNILTNRKIRFSKYSSIFTLRKDFADCLNERGLKYKTSLRKDSLEVVDGLGSSTRNKNQNYILSQVEKDLGKEARDWAKKQFINKYSDDEKKAQEAKENLRLIKKKEDPQTREEILKRVKVYQRQKEKWQAKQHLYNRYPKLDKKSINSYVDSLFAAEKKASGHYNSNNERRVKNLKNIQNRISDLKNKDVTAQIVEFKSFLDRNSQRETEAKNFTRLGVVGQQYLRQLYRNLDFSKTDKQREIVQNKIDDLKKGSVDAAELDFFRQALINAGSKQYQSLHKERIAAIREDIARKAKVDIREVDQVEKIFDLYCARRVGDSVFAYRQFRRGIKTYIDVLQSKNERRILNVSEVLSQKLGIKPGSINLANSESAKKTPLSADFFR